MKAQDLSIGSLVRVNKDVCIKKGTVVEIRQIDADNTFKKLRGCAFCRPLDKEQFGGGVWLDYLDPIPLTSEILEKNGFGYENNAGYVYDNYEGTIIAYSTFPSRLRIIKDLNILYDSQDYADIYVHTLQHALRLCGIEKEIVL